MSQSFTGSTSARATPSAAKPSPVRSHEARPRPAAPSATSREQRLTNLRVGVVATAPPARPPPAAGAAATGAPAAAATPTAPPSVVRVMTTRLHATGELRSQARVTETDEAFLTVPTRANPLVHPVVTHTSATFSIVDTVPVGATLARREMEAKLDAQAKAEAERLLAQRQAEKQAREEAEQRRAEELRHLQDNYDLAVVNAKAAGLPAPPPFEIPEHLRVPTTTALHSSALPSAAAVAEEDQFLVPQPSGAPSNFSSHHVSDPTAPSTLDTLVVRTSEGLDILDFECVSQKLLALVEGSPVHDHFSNVLSDFFKRVFQHFLTIDAVKRESAGLAHDKQLLMEATRDIERELRLLKQQNSAQALTISTQEGQLSRRTADLTQAREKYYASLLQIRDFVQQHGIHPDVLVQYMPGDIANSDAKFASNAKARADQQEQHRKIEALLDHKQAALFATMKTAIFAVAQTLQKKLDRCNTKIRSLDVFLSRQRYKMRKQIYVYDLLLKGELTEERQADIRAKHAKEEEMAEVEKMAKRSAEAAAAAAEAAGNAVTDANNEEAASLRDRSLAETSGWRELVDIMPQGYKMLINLQARHRAQWERMERQARDGDCELMDEEDMAEHLETVFHDSGSVPRTARSESAGDAWMQANADNANADGSALPTPTGSKKSQQLPPSASRSHRGTMSRRNSRKVGGPSPTKQRRGSTTDSANSSRRATATGEGSLTSSIDALLGTSHPHSGKKKHHGGKSASKSGSPQTKSPALTGRTINAAKHPRAASADPDGGGGRDSGSSSASRTRGSSVDGHEHDDGTGGGGVSDSSDRQHRIEQGWTEVETEALEREERAKLRRRDSKARRGTTDDDKASQDDSPSSSRRGGSVAATPDRDSPSRATRGGRGATGSLLRPQSAHQSGAAGGWGGFSSESPSPSPRGGGGALRSHHSRESSTSSARRSQLRTDLGKLDDELARSTDASAELERRNRDIMERIKALDNERKMLGLVPAAGASAGSNASGSGNTSGLASLHSTRRNSMLSNMPLEEMLARSSAATSSLAGDSSFTASDTVSPSRTAATGSVLNDGATDAGTGTAGGSVAGDSVATADVAALAPQEFEEIERQSEEAKARAKEDRLARIQQATQLERAKRELERERRLMEKENSKLTSKLRQLESKKKEMRAALEEHTPPSSTRGLAPGAAAAMGGGPVGPLDVREHANIFHKVVMRSVGLQVGVPFTYAQQQAAQGHHSPARGRSVSPGKSGSNEAKEAENGPGTTSGMNFMVPSNCPHPLVLQMQALGVDPRAVQAFIQQHAQARAARGGQPPPTFDMSGALGGGAGAGGQGDPNWELYQAAFQNTNALLDRRSYLEGGADPASAVHTVGLGGGNLTARLAAQAAAQTTEGTARRRDPSASREREPSLLESISSSLTLTPSQRDLLFKQELKRKKKLEQSMSVFARLQSRGATSEESAQHLRSLMHRERQVEIERVLRDLDLLKTFSVQQQEAAQQQLYASDASGANLRPGSAVSRGAGGSRPQSRGVRTPGSSSSATGSRPTTATLRASPPLPGEGVGAWDTSDSAAARAPYSMKPVAPRHPAAAAPCYPHVNAGMAPARSGSTAGVSATSAGGAIPSAADRRSNLLSSVMGEQRMSLQQQEQRRGQSYSAAQ